MKEKQEFQIKGTCFKGLAVKSLLAEIKRKNVLGNKRVDLLINVPRCHTESLTSKRL